MNLKQHKKGLIISSIVILLPMVLGILLWDHLPELVPMHWNISGEVDNLGDKYFTVFWAPLLFLAMHWLCILCTVADKKNSNQSKKVTGMILWIFPCLSWFITIFSYGIAKGAEWNFIKSPHLIFGLTFAFIGNYMPKCKQNSTIGIKIPWTLANEENWNVTHRVAGKLWFIGGIIMLFTFFLPASLFIPITLPMIILLAVVPMVYSQQYYRKQIQSGTAIPLKDIPVNKKMRLFSIVMTVIVLIFVGFILFSGDIAYSFGETTLTIDPSFHKPVSVSYDAIDSIEYREGNIPGTRINGFGSLHLLLGYFENEEFGNHFRYTYYKPESCVVLTVSQETIVLSGKTTEESRLIYETLLSK